MGEHKYTFSILPGKEDFALVKLGSQVLGGTDALNFTGTLNEVSKTPVKTVVVDCSSVEVMNSSGLGMLVSGLTTLKKYNIAMSLISLPRKVEDLMKMTRLDSIFKIYPDINSVV